MADFDEVPSLEESGLNRSLTKANSFLNNKLPPDMRNSFSDGVGINALGSQEMGHALSFGSQMVTVQPHQDLQKYINYVSDQGGGTVRLISGTYILTHYIVIPSNINLVGEGPENTIVDFDNNTDANFRVGSSSIPVLGVRIAGMEIKNSGTGRDGLSLEYASKFIIEDVTFDSNANYGLKALNCQRFLVSNCYATSNGQSGFGIVGTDDNNPTAYFTFLNCFSFFNTFQGFYLLSFGRLTLVMGALVGCSAGANTQAGFVTIATTTGGVVQPDWETYVSMSNCVSIQNSAVGYLVSSSVNQLADSKAIQNTGVGIRLNEEGGLTPKDNTVVGNSMVGNLDPQIDNESAVGDNVVESNAGSDDSSLLERVYPIGSIYINATNSTNPATLLGFGTWSSFGASRVMVGFDSGDGDFNSAEETGGSKTVNLSHTHSGPSHSHSVPSHAHNFSGGTGPGDRQNRANPGSGTATNDGNHAHSFSGTTDSGGGGSTGASGTGNTSSSLSSSQSIVQPYITAYLWKRTA